MPDDLTSSLQNTLREQLKAEQLNSEYNNNRSSYLRHPAFTLAFSLVLVVGVLLNNWTDVEQQLAPMPEMSREIEPEYKPQKTLAPSPQAALAPESESEPENAYKPAPESMHDSAPVSLLERSEPPITDVASTADVLVMQAPNTRQTTQQATQIVQGMQKPEAYSYVSEPQQKLAAENLERENLERENLERENKAKELEKKQRQQKERLAKSKHQEYQEVERISISHAEKNQLPPEPERYLLEVTAIDKQQITFTDCYEVKYNLSASLSAKLKSRLKPQLAIGDKFTVIENPNESLTEQLDSWSEKLKLAPTGTTCD